MSVDCTETSIARFPHAFVTRRGEPLLVQLLTENRHEQLVAMYLAFQPRNCFGGLPPITDQACVRWVRGMIADAASLVAMSFDEGLVGHAALFAIGRDDCEMLNVVTPREQGVGIGTELARCAVQLADELGFETVRLNVEAGNHVARHVFEKCGFQYGSRALVGELDMSLDLQHYRQTTDVAVAEIMRRQVVSVGRQTTCREALAMFLRDGIASLPVVSGSGRLLGILTESDLLVPANIDKRVGEVLTRAVIFVHESARLEKVIKLFRARKVRCIPVVDRRGAVVGVVGRRDVLAHYARRLGR